MFKDELRSEAYLVKLNVKDRLLMTKFRCRNSKLPICKRNVDYDYDVNKQCVLCNSEDIGDDIYCKLKCDKFKLARNVFLEP